MTEQKNDSPGRYALLDDEWIIETQHGVYPIGTWGFCCAVAPDDDVQRVLGKSLHANNRAYNNTTGAILYPTAGGSI